MGASASLEDGLNPGDLLAGRYRLVDRIGWGGMAVIWRAHDETLDRLVAVKVLDLSLSSDVRLRDLVRREAWAGARLNHPDVASVHDFVHLGAFGVLVMQLVEGDPLADLIATGPLDWAAAARIARRVANVLEHAHSRGVVHRDVTPDNVVIHADQVKVLDFGIAARIGEPDDDSTGASFGTPGYVAPERLDGTPAQAATDIYALGVITFEMLTGHVPYRVRGWDDVAVDHGPPPSLRAFGIPSDLDSLVHRMLSRDPSARPRAPEVLSTLDTLLRPRRWLTSSRTSLGRGAVALVSVAALFVAVLALWRPWNPATGDSGQWGRGSVAVQPSSSSAPALESPHPLESPSPQGTQPTATPPSRTTTPPAVPVPTATSAPLNPSPKPTRQQAIAAAMSLVDEGMTSGSISQDSGVDLKQVLRNTTQPSQVDNLRTKVTDREREGSITPEMATRLQSALDTLATTMTT